MKKLKETLNFQPVFNNTVFDNDLDCRWAIFFEAMGYSWGYKTPTDYCDILQPTFSFLDGGTPSSYRAYSVNREIPNDELEKLRDWGSSTNVDLILLDGPPTIGAYVVLRASDNSELSFEQAQQLMKVPQERFGGIFQGPDEAIRYDQAEDYFNPNSLYRRTEGFSNSDSLYQNPIAIKIKKAVVTANKGFLNAAKHYTTETIHRKSEYLRDARLSTKA